MKVVIKDTYEEMTGEAIAIFLRYFDRYNVLGFATGKTPILFYKRLTELYSDGELSFQKKISFNLDEYYKIDPKNKRSFRYYMERNLFDKVNIRKENIHFPDSKVSPRLVVSRYRKEFDRSGPVDLQLLGIGKNGHIAFNEPGSTADSEIRIVGLTDETIKRNNSPKNRAVTMGIREILSSRIIILLARGADKSRAVCEAIKGPVTPEVPASFLQLHNNTFFVLDKDAAERLEN